MTFSKIHSAGIITAFAIRSSNHKSSVNWYSCSHWRISGRKWNCFWLILQRVFFSLKDNLRSALHKFGKKRPYFLEVLIRTNHTQSVTGYFFILEWTQQLPSTWEISWTSCPIFTTSPFRGCLLTLNWLRNSGITQYDLLIDCTRWVHLIYRYVRRTAFWNLSVIT